MKFQQIKGFNDILNSEGPILCLAERIGEFDDKNHRSLFLDEPPYIRAECNKGKNYIYTSINKHILSLYFQGRIMAKEIFLLNMDQPFYIEEHKERTVTKHIFSEDFNDKYIETIETGDKTYHHFPIEMRLADPFEDIIRYWEQIG